MARYQVENDSNSGHSCCFEATVVDTSRQQMIGYKDAARPYFVDGKPKWESVCECFTVDEAQMIADALNAKEPQP